MKKETNIMTKLTKRALLVVVAIVCVFTLTFAACQSTATLTFVGGEGAIGTPPRAITAKVGEEITLPENSFTKDGHTFAGWKIGNKTLSVGDKYILNADAQAVAQWTKNGDGPLLEDVAITYKAGEGTGSDVVVNKSKGMAFNLATASDIGTAFTAPDEGKMLVGWKLQGDSSSKVYGMGEEYTAQAATTFIAQWGDKQIVAYDTNFVATLVLNVGENTGILDIEGKETELTYTLTGTALTVTIDGNTYTGTLDGYDIEITIVYKTVSYVFTTEPAPVNAPTVTFNANGGSGTAPQIGELTADSVGYKLVLPENTFTAPDGKEFKEWNVVVDNGKGTARKVGEYIYLYAGEEAVVNAVWQDAEIPVTNKPVTFTGNCTVPTKSGAFGLQQGGQTYVKLVVDVDTLKVTYYISTSEDGVEATAQDKSAVNYKPTKYGSDALYLEVNMADNVAYYLLIKADMSELTLCDSDDEPLTNGVFTAEAPATVTVTYAKPEGAEGEVPASVTADTSEKYTLIANPFTMIGYTFAGWQIGTESQLKVAGAKIDLTKDTTITAVFSKVYTNVDNTSDLLKISLRTDGMAVIDSYPYDCEAQEDGALKIDLDFYTICVEINSNGTFVELDVMRDYAFTSTEDVQLTFDGKGGAKLGTINGTYIMIVEDYYLVGFNLTIGGETYEIELEFNMDTSSYVINVKITVDGTDYIFGNPPEKYIITFELGDGEEGTAPEAITVWSNVGEVTLPSGAGITKEGYRFVGWKLKDGESDDYFTGTIEVGCSGTLVPAWVEDNGGGGGDQLTKISDFAGESADAPVVYGYTSLTAAGEDVLVVSSYNIYKIEVYWGNNGGVACWNLKRYQGTSTTGSQQMISPDGTEKLTDQNADISTLLTNAFAGYKLEVVFGVNDNGLRTITLTVIDNSTSAKGASVTWTEIK